MNETGFRRYARAGNVLWLAEAWVAELEPLDLMAPGRLERWRDGAPAVPGGRARGWRISLGSGRSVHLREMAHGGWLRGLTGRRFLTARRAIASLESAAALIARDVAVPAPVAMHARRRGAFWHLCVANEFIADVRPGGSFLEQSPDLSQAMAAAAGRAIRAFHDAGARHRDLHVDNLLVRDAARACEVVIVDLDGVRIGAPPSPSRRRRELARLQRSLRKRPLGATLQEDWARALHDAYAACGTTSN